MRSRLKIIFLYSVSYFSYNKLKELQISDLKELQQQIEKKLDKFISNNKLPIKMSEQQQDRNSCSMVGLLGILIQVGLGALSFSVLILKRYFQHPKRPWKIWTFDASKQMISQLIAHFINLTISLALTYDRQNSDECLWYFVTNVFDNTVGVLICIMMLKFVEATLRKKRRFELISGNYYRTIDRLSLAHQGNIEREEKKQQQLPAIKNIKKQSGGKQTNSQKQKSLIDDGDSKIQAFDPQLKKGESQKQNAFQQQRDVEDNYIYIVNYKAWILQLCIWNGIVIIGKCFLFGLQFGLEKQLQQFSIYILGWIEDYPVLELLVVIVIIPVIMNGLAYWVQDNFLMKHQKNAQEKNLIQENLKENTANINNLNDEINDQNAQEYCKNKTLRQQNKNSHSNKSNKQSQLEDNGARFEFHDDYDAKDDENPTNKFQKFFDKFGKLSA